MSAPLSVVLGRVASRSNNPYGKTAEEQAEIGRNMSEVEPLLRLGATGRARRWASDRGTGRHRRTAARSDVLICRAETSGARARGEAPWVVAAFSASEQSVTRSADRVLRAAVVVHPGSCRGRSVCTSAPSPGLSPAAGFGWTSASAHGTPLCLLLIMRDVLGWGSAGPGSDFSEVSTLGFGSTALDCRVAPRCPPGPVWSRLASVHHLPVDGVGELPFGARMASIVVLPSASGRDPAVVSAAPSGYASGSSSASDLLAYVEVRNALESAFFRDLAGCVLLSARGRSCRPSAAGAVCDVLRPIRSVIRLRG